MSSTRGKKNEYLTPIELPKLRPRKVAAKKEKEASSMHSATQTEKKFNASRPQVPHGYNGHGLMMAAPCDASEVMYLKKRR
jgi:hypothetical protein